MASNTTLAYEVMGTLLLSLTPERKEMIKKITSHLVSLRIPQESLDAILAAIILEAAESQFATEKSSNLPKENAISILKPIFTEKKNKKDKDVKN